MYTERFASSSNTQYWWFYIDRNFNGIMESGEPILCINWKGSNGSTGHSLYAYNPSNPSGDPLVDLNGYADGYTLPGTLTYVKYIESLSGGSSSGLEMECRISWSDIEATAGSPLKFHISSSNSTNLPSQIDDNMGRPGGGAGSTGYADLLWTSNNSKIAVLSTVNFYHILCNLGNVEDTFDFSYTSTGDFAPLSIDYYEDSNSNGTFDLEDQILNDSDNDSFIDSGNLLPKGCIRLFAVISIPSNVSNSDISNVTIKATSSYNANVYKNILDVITINQDAQDTDGDGLTDEQELQIGSNPNDSDSDDYGDGLMNFLDSNENIPNLLRNDITTSLSSYNPSQIFVNYPNDPSLDKFGPVPDGICHEGEGNLLYQNGSEDDDDFYAYHINSPYIDPDENVLTDNSRPLVFYQLDCQNCIIFLTKENGKIKITY